LSKSYLFPVIVVGVTFHNVHLYLASHGTDDTAPSNALSHFLSQGSTATSSVASNGGVTVMFTDVANTILEDVYDTRVGKPRVGTVENSNDGARANPRPLTKT